MNSESFKKAMSTLPTGITVVTTSYNNALYGFTANSFTSVSLLPPLVSFCIRKGSSSANGLIESNYFAVNILAEHQADLSMHFSKFHIEKFVNIPYTTGAYSSSPLISGAVSHLECKKFAHYQAGDHIIVIGEVVNAVVNTMDNPLVRQLGRYRELK